MVCLRSLAVSVGVGHPGDSFIVKVLSLLYVHKTYPVQTHTTVSLSLRLVMFLLLLVTQSSGVWCSVWGSSHDGTKAQFASSPGANTDMWGLCMCLCAVRVDLPFLLLVLLPEGAQTFQLWVLSPYSFPLTVLSSLRGISSKVFQESSINVRAEEPRVWVSFHQPVNYLLSIVKAVHGGSLDVPFDLFSGVIVNVDLEWGT